MYAVLVDNEIIYGRCTGNHFAIHELNTKGAPVYKGKNKLVWPGDLRRVVYYWGGGVKGIAESTFPHPEEWRYGAIDKHLDQVTVVRDLTREYTRDVALSPFLMQIHLGSKIRGGPQLARHR